VGAERCARTPDAASQTPAARCTPGASDAGNEAAVSGPGDGRSGCRRRESSRHPGSECADTGIRGRCACVT
jgi:hypothetical protein